MPRQNTPDLQKVNLAPAARQVNTFVQGRRAVKDNSASRLASALQGGSQILENIQEQGRKDNLEQVEVDIQRATDNKLAGGNLFSDTYRDNIADYEEVKGTLGTPEDAAKYFLEKNQREFEDPHEAAGYNAKLKEKFSDFRATHNKYLVTEKIKGRNIALTKSFYNDVLDGKTAEAFTNMKQAADNYGAKATQTNGLVLESVKAMLAQGRVDKAEEVLNFQRGPAKSLVENSETTEEATRLMKRVVDTREAIKAARLEDTKVQNRVSDAAKIANENTFFDDVLGNEELTNTQKILQLENAMGSFEINKDFYVEVKRKLVANNKAGNKVDNALYASLLQKTHNLAATAEALTGEEENNDYLRGIRNIRLEVMKADTDGLLGTDGSKLLNQINSLTNAKEATALAEIGKSFDSATSTYIETNIAPQNRGEVIKKLFFESEDIRAQQKAAEDKGERFDVKDAYLQRAQEVITKYKDEQINKSSRFLQEQEGSDTLSVYMQKEAISDSDLKAMARAESSRLGREVTVSDIKRGLSKRLEGGLEGSEEKQILIDEGVQKDAEGNHVSYKDTEGHLTGGHGHLMTDAEKLKYPEGTPIPKEVVDKWKTIDLKEAKEDVSAIFGEVKNPEVASVLQNMAFNLGRTKLNKFTRLKEAVKNEDYALMVESMRDSLWFDQVGERSKRLVTRIENLT